MNIKIGIEAIGEFIQNYSKVEYIGLAKNDIDNLEPLKSLFAAIGRRVLSAEELAIYREKEKEKESIISKAVKNKKKVTEDMYPHLDPLVSLPDGCNHLTIFFLIALLFFRIHDSTLMVGSKREIFCFIFNIKELRQILI